MINELKFLKLVSQMAPRSKFQMELDLSPKQIEFHKNRLGIESPEEARILHNKLSKKQVNVDNSEKIKAARQKEAEAQNRLDKKTVTRKPKVRKITKEDARQELLERELRLQNQEAEAPKTKWKLPEEFAVDDFRREITYRGLNFVSLKYGVSKLEIKNEANRLKLKINWDLVKR